MRPNSSRFASLSKAGDVYVKVILEYQNDLRRNRE